MMGIVDTQLLGVTMEVPFPGLRPAVLWKNGEKYPPPFFQGIIVPDGEVRAWVIMYSHLKYLHRIINSQERLFQHFYNFTLCRVWHRTLIYGGASNHKKNITDSSTYNNKFEPHTLLSKVYHDDLTTN